MNDKLNPVQPKRGQPSNMRKYQRLLLVILTIVSVTLLLIYERKYSRIKLVLQYMDVIGSKPSLEDCQALLKNNTDKEFPKPLLTTYGDTGTPLWKEVVNGYFVYSAFWDSHKKDVKAIGLTRNVMHKDIICLLWYWDQKKPVKGQLRREIKATDDKTSQSSVIIFSCSYSAHNGIPYGISFQEQSQENYAGSLIIIPVVSQKSLGVLSTRFSACVNVLSHNTTLNTLPVEFIEYYTHIGIEHFIFYDQGMHPLLRYLLQNRAVEFGFSIEVLPWNVPHDLLHLSAQAHEYDCIYRNLISASYFVKLGINQFLVLRDTYVSFVLHTQPFQKAQFKVKLFCNEFDSDIVAKTLGFPFQTLKKTKYYNISHEIPVVYSSKKILDEGRLFHSQSFQLKVGALYVYDMCVDNSESATNPTPTSYQVDAEMLKWKQLFFQSKLYQAYSHDVSLYST